VLKSGTPADPAAQRFRVINNEWPQRSRAARSSARQPCVV